MIINNSMVLFLDTAGTIPATEIGQRIACVKSVNDGATLEAVMACAPTLQRDDKGVFFLRLDGALDQCDDYMDSWLLSTWFRVV